MPTGASSASNSRCLPTLAVASTSIMGAMFRVGVVVGVLRLQRLGLQRTQLADATGRQIEQRVELVATKRMAFGRALHLDEGAAIVHHYVHVRFGLGIL